MAINSLAFRTGAADIKRRTARSSSLVQILVASQHLAIYRMTESGYGVEILRRRGPQNMSISRSSKFPILPGSVSPAKMSSMLSPTSRPPSA